MINRRLSWDEHCIRLVNQANQQLGLVRRMCYFFNDSAQRRALYLSLVRSIFEHCCQVWAPQTAKSLNKFDILQKRAVKWILFQPYAKYSDLEFLNKQKSLDLLPMKYKFLLSDLSLFHKIVYNNVNITFPNYVTRVESQDVLRITRSTHKISKGIDKLRYRCSVRPKVNAFSDSFFVRSIKQWNELPLNIREIDCNLKFTASTKDHLWLILGFEPD